MHFSLPLHEIPEIPQSLSGSLWVIMTMQLRPVWHQNSGLSFDWQVLPSLCRLPNLHGCEQRERRCGQLFPMTSLASTGWGGVVGSEEEGTIFYGGYIYSPGMGMPYLCHYKHSGIFLLCILGSFYGVCPLLPRSAACSPIEEVNLGPPDPLVLLVHLSIIIILLQQVS